jgi:hypothetical protein
MKIPRALQKKRRAISGSRSAILPRLQSVSEFQLRTFIVTVGSGKTPVTSSLEHDYYRWY